RGPTPAVPALQRKHTNVVTSRPSSIVSPLKSKTERIVSAPNTQPVPESKPLAPGSTVCKVWHNNKPTKTWRSS
ncbi:hypothetical protein CHARACLAT_033704, partial [Characodon lateralis]|nr:hypothetical protein [Characodon lateralis]